jgi:hypothetical protein
VTRHRVRPSLFTALSALPENPTYLAAFLQSFI